MPVFSISTHRADRQVTVALAGELDLMTVGELDNALTDVASTKGVTDIVVDLADLSFTDSIGISALIRGRRLADQHGIHYAIVAATSVVRQVLDVTGVWDYLSAAER
ncbi:MAG TPA: STAS domain-containing protein [Micromonosporaceae bacterium]